jgi:hypothetical protein
MIWLRWHCCPVADGMAIDCGILWTPSWKKIAVSSILSVLVTLVTFTAVANERPGRDRWRRR